MNLRPQLLCCVIYADVCGLIGAQVISVTGTEGQGITIRCHFGVSGGTKSFCKGNCDAGNVLVETSETKAQKGKYTIESAGTVQSPVLLVTIKPLSRSDAGRYTCTMRGWLFNSQLEVELTVKAATSSPSSTPSVTVYRSTKREGPEGSLWRSQRFMPLVVCVPAVVVGLAAALILRCRKETRRKADGVNLDSTNTKIDPYDNVFPTREDATYESLDPISRDQDQTYSTLSHTHTTHKGIQE